VIHSYCWALKHKRQYNNDNKFAYFVNKTPVQLGTVITVANCGQLSHLLSEVFKTISNQIICHNRTYTNPSQSCLCFIPLFETQVWHNDPWALRIAKSVKRISRARYSKLGTRTLVTSPTVHAIKPQIWKDPVGNISTMQIYTAKIMCQTFMY